MIDFNSPINCGQTTFVETRKRLDLKLGLGEILQILSITLFEQGPLSEILMKTESQNEEFKFHNQLFLFDL